MPVSINDDYMGYSWSKLAKVIKVEIETGKERLRHDIWCEELACFDNVSITAHTSDGKVFSSKVSMAVRALPQEGKTHMAYKSCVRH